MTGVNEEELMFVGMSKCQRTNVCICLFRRTKYNFEENNRNSALV